MNRLTPLVGINFFLALALLLPFVALAEEEEKNKDDSVPKQDHDPVSAVELIAKLKKEEEALYKIKSLYVRAKATVRRTDGAIDENRKELEAQFPGSELNPEIFSELKPLLEEEYERAFDERRLRQHSLSSGSHLETKVWDGTTALAYDRYVDGPLKQQAYQAIANDPKRFVSPYFLSNTPWKFLSEDKFWWSPPYSKRDLSDLRQLDPPEEYLIADKRDYHGKECYVLENRRKRKILFVTTDEHRLSGFVELFLPHMSKETEFEVIRHIAEIDFKSMEEAKEWCDRLTDEEKVKLDSSIRSIDAYFEYVRPSYEINFEDYREILPEVWCPFQHTEHWFFTNRMTPYDPEVASTRRHEVVEIKVNEPLPDELFTLPMIEGIQVNDFRYGSENILTYTYKRDRTPEEWNAIVEKHRKENEKSEKEKAFRDSLIGKPAFDFPKTTWLGSPPLEWKDLKGKVVVLFFWAHWCGPCHHDLQLLAGYQVGRNDPGVVLIGVHTPGSELEDIEKDIKENGVNYAVMIDTPRPDGPPTWGMMSHQYGVNMMPYAVVIDQEGKIARHGNVSRIIDAAYELPHERLKK